MSFNNQTKLSKNFTLWEFVVSETAERNGINNFPNEEQIANLGELCKKVLQPVRSFLNFPLQISSGFRSKLLNEKVGGSKTSQHCKGEAADLKCRNNAELFNAIKDLTEFDQLIWEFGTDLSPSWIHVSYSVNRNRKQVLKAKRVNGKVIYEKLS